jgi:alginate O-acetyltransferase complex protein AlgI
MIFNSSVFLFLFLPICLLLYTISGRPYKNAVLLAGSLIFYSFGQPVYLLVIFVLILVNYFAARRIEMLREQPERARWLLFGGLATNLLSLVFFKIIASYGTDWMTFFLSDRLFQLFSQVVLPLGFSYLVFQLISYLVDVYNELVDSEKSFLDFSLFVLLFPKIIVGPITRYRDLAGQLSGRPVTPDAAAAGIRRFILGLAKKILIADTLAQIVNPAFGLSTPNFSTGIAWLVLVGYALQLYFDFSGFTDMAIGLGQMFGFRFVENFNYPYISKSISEFWRRWHISLSSWFRDYVFYPLEFTRKRASRWRQALHVLVVFLLTGLWHGLTLNFALWGLIHGLAIALEMSGFGRALKKWWAPLQHGYTLSIILLGWVFFRSPSPAFAIGFLGRLAGWQGGVTPLPFSVTRPLPIIDHSVWAALFLGIFLSLPVFPFLQKNWQRVGGKNRITAGAGRVAADILLLVLLAGSVAFMVGDHFVANIYGNF